MDGGLGPGRLSPTNINPDYNTIGMIPQNNNIGNFSNVQQGPHRTGQKWLTDIQDTLELHFANDDAVVTKYIVCIWFVLTMFQCFTRGAFFNEALCLAYMMEMFIPHKI